MNDKVTCQDSATLKISKSSGQEEKAKVTGTYVASVVGPVFGARWAFVRLRNYINKHKKDNRFLVGMAETVKGLIPTEKKWEEEFPNLVTTVGMNDMLDKYLEGSSYTAAWYMGLIKDTSYTGVDITDTMASHSGWLEGQDYTEGARPTAAWSSAAAGVKALSAALAFSIDATTTIKGCFLTTISTKGGTTGILYSCGLFTGGDKAVGDGDTLNVSYSTTLS